MENTNPTTPQVSPQAMNASSQPVASTPQPVVNTPPMVSSPQQTEMNHQPTQTVVAPQTEISPEAPIKSKTPIWMIALVIVLVISLLALGAWVVMGRNSTAVMTASETYPTEEAVDSTMVETDIPAESVMIADDQTTNETTGAMPDVGTATSPTSQVAVAPSQGYQEKSTLCYTIYLPPSAELSAENDCWQNVSLGYTTDKVYLGSVQVTPETHNLSSAQAMADRGKSIVSDWKVISEESVEVSGKPAVKVVYDASNGGIVTAVTYYVYNPGQTWRTMPVSGYEISKTIQLTEGQAENEMVFENIVNSIVWK